MKTITHARRKFTAQYLADISKAIFAVALASKLFIELAAWWRIGLTILGIGFFIVAFFISPEGEKE